MQQNVKRIINFIPTLCTCFMLAKFKLRLICFICTIFTFNMDNCVNRIRTISEIKNGCYYYKISYKYAKKKKNNKTPWFK